MEWEKICEGIRDGGVHLDDRYRRIGWVFIKSLLNKQRVRDRESFIKKLLKRTPRVITGPREYKDGFNDCNQAWKDYLSSGFPLKSYKLKEETPNVKKLVKHYKKDIEGLANEIT